MAVVMSDAELFALGAGYRAQVEREILPEERIPEGARGGMSVDLFRKRAAERHWTAASARPQG